MTQGRYSDEDLVAYDDGEMAADEAAQLTARLEADAALRSRLDRLRLDRGAMAAAFQTLLEQAPPHLPAGCAPTASVAPQSRRGMSVWAVAASVALAVALGALGHRTLAPQPEMGWQQLAAAYHALYVTETVAVLPPPDPTAAAAQLARSAAALGHPIPTALTAIPGLSFRRAQVLGHDGAAIIQLAYIDDNGVPYAFCLRAVDGAAMRPMTAQGFAGVQGVEWQSGGVEYVLLGKRPQPELQALAEIFRGRV